jgi:hypothetical protein
VFPEVPAGKPAPTVRCDDLDLALCNYCPTGGNDQGHMLDVYNHLAGPAGGRSRMSATLFVGLDFPRTRELGDALSADLVAPPSLEAGGGWAWTFADEIERFAAVVLDGPPAERVVVCTWSRSYEAMPLLDVAATGWMTGVERALALWYSVVTHAIERCADGGAMAVVIERPAGIDSAGHAITTAVGEGLVALTRSCALVHGARGFG